MTTTTPTAEVAKTDRKQLAPSQEIAAMAPSFAMALGGQRLAERFVRVALTALGRNPDLANCTRETLLGGLMTCAQLRLEPNDPRGLAYLIPFKNNKQNTTEAQLVIGYKGLVDLAYRSAQIKTIAAEPVHEQDHFVEQRWPRQLEHRAAQGDRGTVSRYYAAVEYKDGGQDFVVMSVEEIERHRDLYSKGHQRSDSPWKTAFDAMARKTVLRRLAKMMPLSVEDMRPFAAAVQVDGTAGTLDASQSLEDLLSRDRPAIDAGDVDAQPSRVTAAEISANAQQAQQQAVDDAPAQTSPQTPPSAATPAPPAEEMPTEPAAAAAESDPAASETAAGSTPDCPGCGKPVAHSPDECPGSEQLDMRLDQEGRQ